MRVKAVYKLRVSCTPKRKPGGPGATRARGGAATGGRAGDAREVARARLQRLVRKLQSMSEGGGGGGASNASSRRHTRVGWRVKGSEVRVSAGAGAAAGARAADRLTLNLELSVYESATAGWGGIGGGAIEKNTLTTGEEKVKDGAALSENKNNLTER